MPNKNGLHLITPTSIASTGTGNSSSINTNGSVTFSTCATLSLNGVFSADYDNYMIVMRHTSSTAHDVPMRLRSSGTDNSTASSYVYQRINASSTTIAGVRSTTNQWYTNQAWNTQRAGVVFHLYGPYLAQPTAYRTITVSDPSSASILDHAGTHNQSTSYDGFSLLPDAGNFTGLLAVYGMRN